MNMDSSKDPFVTLNETKVRLELPNQCPHCGIFMFPEKIVYTNSFQAPLATSLEGSYFAVVFRCPHCGEFFLTQYSISYENAIYLGNIHIVRQKSDIPFPFSKEINQIDPAFEIIYSQTQRAEFYGLDELTGMGYRKALEHLLRTYYKEPEKTLSQIINAIDNPEIQSLAKLATWIGNDHAHIQIKHPTQTIENMKGFIEAIVYHILMKHRVQESSDYIASK